jgi:peptidyl-tRNA hydrolase
MERLYIVVRADLDLGLQMAQAIHAAKDFGTQYPHEDFRWRHGGNNVVVLEVPDEKALMDLHLLLMSKRVATTLFTEVDLGGEATALSADTGAKRYVRGLPLAGAKAAKRAA